MKVTQKTRENNKSAWDVEHERDAGKARLRNYSGQESVEMFWGMNEMCRRDGVFIIRIDDKEAYLSAEELRRYLRWC